MIGGVKMKKCFIAIALIFLLLFNFGQCFSDGVQRIPSKNITAFIKDVVSGVSLKLADWGGIYTADFLQQVAEGGVEGYSLMTKFGENPEVDIAAPETVWDGGGLYTWVPLVAESLEVLSTSGSDVGSVLSSGTATGGSIATLIDTGATFSSDGVAVGDLVINDTNDEFAIIVVVTETTLTLVGMSNGSQADFSSTANASGDTYRVATATSGLGVGAVFGTNGSGSFENEIFVMNGTTEVTLKRDYNGTFRMAGILGATTAGNVGDIKCQTVVGSTLTAQMRIGMNKTLMACIRTPSDKLTIFLKGYVGITKTGNPSQTNTAKFTWRVLPFGSVISVNGVMELISTGSSWWQYEYLARPIIPPNTFIDIRCDLVSHDDTGVVAGMDILFKDLN